MNFRKIIAASTLVVAFMLPIQVRAESDCLLKGSIRLIMSGDIDSGSINGSVGKDPINWTVFYGQVHGWVADRMATLEISSRPFGQDFEIRGWIGKSYIRWRSIGDSFSGYQPCITE